MKVILLHLFLYTIIFLHGCQSITEYFVTDNCNTTIGQTYGDVLRFDVNSNQDAWVIPSGNLDCWITFQGYQAEVDTPQRYGTLQWRTDNHYLAGHGWHSASSGCETAYVEVYNASETGEIYYPPLVGPVCGTALPDEATTTTGVLVLRIYVEAPPEGTYNSSIVANEDRFTAPPSCANDTSLNTSSMNITNNSNVTSDNSTNTSNGTNSTVCTTQYGPFINFTVDFTSYFIGNCSQDNIDDEQQFECDPGSQRCIAKSLRCDWYYSNNCGDNGDVRAGPPGNCTYDETTTEAPHTTPSNEPKTTDLLPLWITMAVLAGLMMAYWCCWRPGWLPWRLARLRNVRCCQSLSRCCQKSCGCCKRLPCFQGCARGGACVSALCCVKCQSCSCCTETGSGYPHSHLQYNLQQKSNTNTGTTERVSKPWTSVTPKWMKFANDDGAHIREMR